MHDKPLKLIRSSVCKIAEDKNHTKKNVRLLTMIQISKIYKGEGHKRGKRLI